jgi:hypothetical protein
LDAAAFIRGSPEKSVLIVAGMHLLVQTLKMLSPDLWMLFSDSSDHRVGQLLAPRPSSAMPA